MRKRIASILFAMIFLLSLPACSSNERKTSTETSTAPTAAPSPTPAVDTVTPTPEPTATPIANFKLPVPGERPVAVMIDNEGTRSLPQGGMYMAQVIYEIIVEGGETRLMPVFWGTAPEMIGPVRSSRHYFLDYVLENDAIYVHFGWSPMAQRDIPKLKINNINGVSNGGEIFWDLTKEKYNWQDSYTSMKNIMNYVKKVKYRTTTEKKPVFSYKTAIAAPLDGKTANKVTLKFSHSYTCGFEYDSSAKLYSRIRKGKPQMERNNGEQLKACNIIIQITPSNSIKGDDKGRQEVSTVGKGTGYVIMDGKAKSIKWSKESRSAATEYKYEDGSEVLLNPGQTWVEVIPAGGKITIE